MKTIRKTLVLLLAVAMIFSMIPSASFAWADTENTVDAGDDGSSVFVVEENTTEEAGVEEQAEEEQPADADLRGDDKASVGSIKGFSIQLSPNGITNHNGNMVLGMSSSAAGQSAQYNVVWTVAVPNDSYAVGEIEIRLPRSIFYHYVLNEDGTVQTDGSGNPIRELDQDTESNQTYSITLSGDFPYTMAEDGDDLVFTNSQAIANTQAIHQFTITYYTTHQSFDYVDYEDHDSDMTNSQAHTCETCGSRPMIVTITDKESEEVYEATGEEVYIDTSAEISSVRKSLHSQNVLSWPTYYFGPEEENSEDYNYVQYTVYVEMKGNPTERFRLDLADLFTDRAGNGDGIVAYSQSNNVTATGFSGFVGDPVVFDEPQTSVNITVDNCTSKYFRFNFLVRTVKPTTTLDYSGLNINQKNDVTVTATPICGREISDGSSSVTFTKSFTYTYPKGLYMVRKFGNDNYSQYLTNYVWPACTYKLNDFKEDPSIELEGLRYVVDFYGSAMRLTNDSDNDDPSRVGMKKVMWELIDDGANILLTDGLGEPEESTHLSSDDYYLKALALRYDGYGGGDYNITADEYFDVATGTWKSKPRGMDFYDNDAVTLYVKKGDSTEWIKAADISSTMVSAPTIGNPDAIMQQFSIVPTNPDATGAITMADGYQPPDTINGRNYPGATILFEAKDITGYKITNENKHTKLHMTLYPEYVLKHSSRVDNFVAGKDKIGLYNEADLAVYEYDPDNDGTDVYSRVFFFSEDAKPVYQVDRKATDYAIGAERYLQVDKAYITGENSGSEEAYFATWSLNAGVWYIGGVGAAHNNYSSQSGTEACYEQQFGGKFYDLLPQGTGVERDSIKVYKVKNASQYTSDDYLLTEGENEDYTVDLTYDRDAKQYMFVINIKTESLQSPVSVKENGKTVKLQPGYTVLFDTKTSWTSLDDYGTVITNAMGYKTDGLHPMTYGNNAQNVGASELKDLQDEETYNVNYSYTISKMESAVEANRDFLAFDFAYDHVGVHYDTSSVSGVYKRVQGENDTSVAKETTVGPGDTYKYNLRYQSGAVDKVEHIVIYDNIENYGDWDWRGTLKGFDFSELPDEVTPTVYYTEQDVDFDPYVESGIPPISDTALNWQELTASTDLSTVRSIAISMGDYEMGSYSSLIVWVEFDAPAENATDKQAPVAMNNTYVSCTQNDYTTVSPGNFVTVKIEVLGEIKIHKTDEYGEPIENVQFTLTGTDKFGNDVNLTDTTNSRGNLTFSDLPISGTEGYALTETTPSGFIDEGRTWTVVVNTDGTVTVDGEDVSDVYYNIVNRKETTANADKKWLTVSGSTQPPQGATVVFTLFADGENTGISVTLDGTAETAAPTTAGGYEANPWVAQFVHLPLSKIENGTATPIEYTIKESVTYPGFRPSTQSAVASGETITNEEVPTELSVTKAWKNVDGSTTAPDGAEVIFTLFADGEATEYTVTLDGEADTAITTTGGYESEAWKATFVNLPKYKNDNGVEKEIKYTVKETGTWPGYTESYSTGIVDAVVTSAVDGGTITNIQEETVVVVKKAWENADGTTEAPDGATVTFTLYADGTKTDYTAVLDGTAETTVPEGTDGFEPEAWTAAFVHLPKYNGDDEIVYTVTETSTWPGYTVSYGDNNETFAVDGGVITNTEVATGISVTKAWKNADGSTTAPEGAKVTFTLYADGEPTNYSVELVGVDNADSIMQGGQETPAWTATFVRLPKYKIVDDKQVEIEYTVVETGTWPGYTVSYGDNEETFAVDGGVITNEQITTEIGGTKTWNDDEFFVDGVPVNGYQRPESITIDLLADGTVIDSVTVTEDDEWEYEFTDLPKYKIVDGKAVEIQYTVTEDTVAGYEGVVTGTDVDNTPVKDENVAPTMMFLRKVDALTWAEPVNDDPVEPDDPEEPAMRAESVDTPGLGGAEFTLTDPNGGEKVLTTDENGTLEIEFTVEGTYKLVETKAPDGYQNPGTVYTITVDKVFQRVELVDDENAPGGKVWRWFYQLEADVDADYDANTNTLTVKDPPELINIEGEKIWDDQNDRDGIRPKSITVELYADGEKIDEQEVTAANNWKFTFKDLPKMKDGEEIVYTIDEVAVKDYTTKIEGFTITNSHTPSPKTGDDMNLGLWISLMIMAMAAMGIIGVRKLIGKR